MNSLIDAKTIDLTTTKFVMTNVSSCLWYHINNWCETSHINKYLSCNESKISGLGGRNALL